MTVARGDGVSVTVLSQRPRLLELGLASGLLALFLVALGLASSST